ncbi:Pullulanase [Sulfidibacter corallicola]|uniref:pullulanase n=1 Tax=Sulfidibacter corallicola TaxID=2818388 RepID=A0A8A4TH46_SULCO|nr:pullulanase-type alpha-1,6-glucosidase [Sulfidibacter corallicola]QTD49389.1 pullulanase-type alpha-1,6-glucosidase [Sulfidibacter corallicola]
MLSATPPRWSALMLLALWLCSAFAGTPPSASHDSIRKDNPDTVTIAGSLQAQLGCPGDWQPECSTTFLTLDDEDDVWQATWTVPAGEYAYKAALNGTWDENYGADATAGGSDIILNLTEETAVKFYYDHRSHWVTDNHNDLIVTAAGDFQSELGCGADWDPSCLGSWLQDPDGDGIYRLDVTLPRGDYQCKATIDESWDVNYGADGQPGGDNIAFSVEADQADVTFTFDPSDNLLRVDVDIPVAGGEPAVQHAIQDEVFYFVLPDRFENGRVENDFGSDPGGDSDDDRIRHGFWPQEKGYFHGGDLVGLTNRLDYLQNLGVTAIWMTPVFRNRTVQSDTTSTLGFASGYHGYWIVDFLGVDPHLGSEAELRALIDAAHGRGMKIFFDLVVNHTADVIRYAEDGNAYRSKEDAPYRDAAGNAFDDRDYAGGEAFPELDPATSFPYTPTFPTEADANAKSPAWLNDPIYYHNRGNSTFVGENSLYGDFFGLDDLFTEHPDVVDGFIDICKHWIDEFGIDGFRLDTVKHVNIEFWQSFAPAVTAHAQSAGIADFFMFGEVFEFNPALIRNYTTAGRLPSALDFAFKGAAEGFAVHGAPTHDLRGFFEADDYYTDADSNVYQMATYLSNHDSGRLGFALRSQPTNDAERMSRFRLAHALMFFARGFPILYYGDEQGFVGGGGDKDSREDMLASQTADYNDNDLIGTDATTAQANFDQSHPLYQAIAELSATRAAESGLRRGFQITRYSQPQAGIFAFSRIDPETRVEYVVALNNGTAEASAQIATFSPATAFEAVLPAGGSALQANDAGQLDFSLAGLSYAVYRAAAPISVPAPSAPTFTNPTEGGSVDGLVEVAVSGNENTFGTLSFAVSVDGGDWQPIGTDTNPPYRVFFDTTEMASGTPLRFRAIFDDLAGQARATEVSAQVGSGSDSTPSFAIVHYQREDGDYGDHTTGDFNDFWGLHLWGDAIDPDEATEWPAPKPFLGESSYGRFAWIGLSGLPGAVNFIVHRGDTKDGTDADRAFDINEANQIWIRQDDGSHYFSQAAAEGAATIRYQRPDGDYGVGTEAYWGLHLWSEDGANAIDPAIETDWGAPRQPDGVDEFGAWWRLPLNPNDPAAASKPLKFIIHKPGGDDTGPDGDREPGGDRFFTPAETPAIWVLAQDETLYRERGAAENYATIHYHRPDGDYGDTDSDDFTQFWGLHVWNGAASPTGWTSPIKPAGRDGFGVYFRVPLQDGATELAYIIHRGDEKDPDADMFLDLRNVGYEVWQLSGADPEDPYLLPRRGAGPGGPNPGNINERRAYWVSRDQILWEGADDAGLIYTLHSDPDANLATSDSGVEGGTSVTLALDPNGADQAVREKFPHLADLPALRLPDLDRATLIELLRGQLAVGAVNGDGEANGATGLQIPGVLDDLFAAARDEALGIVWRDEVPTFRVWAPTAQHVELHLHQGAFTEDLGVREMTFDPETGIWEATGSPDMRGTYYVYNTRVYMPGLGLLTHRVTDPYSLGLAMGSERSLIVDMHDPATQPADWDVLAKPALAAFEDITIYELHLRDFSITDTTVPSEWRGRYKAFSASGSNGMNHLRSLAASGLTHLHLLPVFDIATIIEDAGQRIEPDFDELADLPANSDMQQDIVSATSDADGFNWGYDPWHYTVPEGSYATEPSGYGRIREFREMVAAVNKLGLRFVMDVVYNHTNASGASSRSVLDRLVPGYYHRLDESGNVTNSTCCDNTAAEHTMMEKLMVDSLVVWARDYKVDAFRFDLMGHHMKRNMLVVREALDALTLAEDGVDGKGIYLYGEGWNFGEVVNGARGENATQLNMAGTGIGTFSDRLRDAVRGGGPFDNGPDLARQGFANGLHTDPNHLPQGDTLATLLLLSDQIRVGLAGNLANYQFEDRTGTPVTGAQVPYGDQPAGYTLDPQEVITYISKHDNQTLYDINVYGLPLETAMADRVRAQMLGLSLVTLGQGVPFYHAGVDMLRSKSLDRDSFNSGDWFNRLDFSYETNNFGVGLPVAEKNFDNWDLMAPLLANPELVPSGDHIVKSAALFRELLRIRYSSELFRLRTAADVQDRLRFHNTGPDQIPGVIVMTVEDLEEADLDSRYDAVAVVFNGTPNQIDFQADWFAGRTMALHPVQASSIDPVVRDAGFDGESGTLTVPGRTVAVYVEPADAADDVLLIGIEELIGVVTVHINDGTLGPLIGTRLLTLLNSARLFAISDQDDFARIMLRVTRWWVLRGDVPPEVADALLAMIEPLLNSGD